MNLRAVNPTDRTTLQRPSHVIIDQDYLLKARVGRVQRCHISQLSSVFNLIMFILGFRYLNTHKHE